MNSELQQSANKRYLYIYIYLYNKLSPVFSSYHILTSSVICYWTDTRQLGIYLLNISGMFQTNVKLTLDATWYFFLHGVWSAVYKWFQCQSDWTGCEMCQRSFRPQRQILSLLFIWHTTCVIWSSKLGMLQKESIMEEVSNKLRGSHLKGQVGSSLSSLIWCV